MARQSRSPLSYEYALLGFLSSQPMHAYEIHQRLRAASGLRLIWTVKQGQLYALLARLEEEGYIASTLEPQAGRPPRKMLSLTDAGEAAFRRWMTAPVRRPRQFRQEFLAKLYFAQQAGSEVLHTLLERQRQACNDSLAELRQQMDGAANRPYDWLVYHLRLTQTLAHLEWLAVCEHRLSAPQA